MPRLSALPAGKGARPEKPRGAADILAPQGTETGLPSFAVYDWDIGEDRIHGDEDLARLFSVSPDDLKRGLPLSAFLKAMHLDDVHTVENGLREAAESCTGISLSYRLRAGDGWTRVKTLGKCYLTVEGEPHLTGVVIADDSLQTAERPPVTLPPRELQCLTWCSQGKTNWEIGRILGISERTVEHHIGSAVRRLGCTSRVQGVALALRFGLIE